MNELSKPLLQKLLAERQSYFLVGELGPFGIMHTEDMDEILDNDWELGGGHPPIQTVRQRLLSIEGVETCTCLPRKNCTETNTIRLYVLRNRP